MFIILTNNLMLFLLSLTIPYNSMRLNLYKALEITGLRDMRCARASLPPPLWTACVVNWN